jgi:hypothetical protein
MALLDDVKLALRISHSKLDGEIADYIASAKEDMIRAGASECFVNASNSGLITTAIKTYVLARMVDSPDMAEKYQQAYEYQLDSIRKSESFFAEPDNGEG